MNPILVYLIVFVSGGLLCALAELLIVKTNAGKDTSHFFARWRCAGICRNIQTD